MAYADAVDYWLAITVLEGQELKQLATATTVHAMSKKGRTDYFKDIDKSTKLVFSKDDGKILSVEEAAKQLGAMLHGR
jgi:hypothetical protein